MLTISDGRNWSLFQETADVPPPPIHRRELAMCLLLAGIVAALCWPHETAITRENAATIAKGVTARRAT
jgi:hypothetical protein